MTRVRATCAVVATLVAGVLMARVLMAPSRVAAMRLDTPDGRLSLAPGPRASEDEKLRAAILSVHAFVEKHRDHGPLVGILDYVDPMPIQAAAAIIKKDASALGDLHRRRALLRLLSWVREAPGVREAVETLIGSAEVTESIYRKLDAPEHGDGCQAENQNTIENQNIINDSLNETLGEVSYKQCSAVKLMAATVVERQGGLIGIASRMVADGSLDGARKGLDPQRWPKCSRLWDATYMVELNNAGAVNDNGHCSPANSPDCMPAQGAAQPIGDAYDTNLPAPPRPLFEHFVCDQTPCDVRLMLHILTQRSSTSTTLPDNVDYFLTYDTPTQWKQFPYPNADYGTVSVTPKDLGGGKTELTVVGDKTFGFQPWGTASAIYLLLRRVEMASYLADLVCCSPP